MSKLRLRPADTLDYSVYLLFRGVTWFLGCLPVSWVFRFGQAIGWFGHLLLGSYRRLERGNIKIAFPDWSREEVNLCAKQHFMDLVANLLCAFALVEKPWEKVEKYLDTTNFERALERINGARSVLWTINHIGNWELFIFCSRFVRWRRLRR